MLFLGSRSQNEHKEGTRGGHRVDWRHWFQEEQEAGGIARKMKAGGRAGKDCQSLYGYSAMGGRGLLWCTRKGLLRSRRGGSMAAMATFLKAVSARSSRGWLADVRNTVSTEKKGNELVGAQKSGCNHT